MAPRRTTKAANDGFANPLDDPNGANAAIASAMASSAATPEIDLPADGIVDLPGGLVTATGKVVREAEVQELTGAHEEALAKARASGNPARTMTALLDSGVVSIGDEPASRAVMSRLLVGDRDALVLGIRVATYGDEIELPTITCPHCGEELDVKLTTEDIPVVKLDDPAADVRFTVDLRKGRKAHVRLAVGADQEALLENPKLSVAEMNTLLLSRVVLAIEDSNGDQLPVAGHIEASRGLSIPDRSKILRALADKQPGPKFDQVKFMHDSCQKEVTLPLGVGDLFRDF